MTTPEEFVSNQIETDISKQTSIFNKQIEDYKEITGLNKVNEDLFLETYNKFINMKPEQIAEDKREAYNKLLPLIKRIGEPLAEEIIQGCTKGQKLIGLDKFPSEHPDHRRIQLMNSEMMDILLKAKNNKDNSYEKNLVLGTAISSLLATNMLVVRAITYQD
jgi:hypothetical protein